MIYNAVVDLSAEAPGAATDKVVNLRLPDYVEGRGLLVYDAVWSVTQYGTASGSDSSGPSAIQKWQLQTGKRSLPAPGAASAANAASFVDLESARLIAMPWDARGLTTDTNKANTTTIQQCLVLLDDPLVVDHVSVLVRFNRVNLSVLRLVIRLYYESISMDLAENATLRIAQE